MAIVTSTEGFHSSQLNLLDDYNNTNGTGGEQISFQTSTASEKTYHAVYTKPHGTLDKSLSHSSSLGSGFLGVIRKFCCCMSISITEDALENPALEEAKADALEISALEEPIADVLEEPIKMCQTSENSAVVFQGSLSGQKVPTISRNLIMLTYCGSQSHRGIHRQVEPSATNEGHKAFTGRFVSENKNVGSVYYSTDSNFSKEKSYEDLVSCKHYSLLGKGRYGRVVKVFHEQKEYAMKKTRFRELEIEIHAALKHKNIIPLLAVIYGDHEERQKVFELKSYHFMPSFAYDLSMLECSYREDYSSDDFKQMLKSSPELSKHRNLKFVFGKILDALSYMHSNGFVHRDVKPSNVMLTMCSKDHYLLHCTCGQDAFEVKLGDFGCACKKTNWDRSDSNASGSTFSYRHVGTSGYLAPEVAMSFAYKGPNQKFYTTAVDIWSFASLVFHFGSGTKLAKQFDHARLLLAQANKNYQDPLINKIAKLKDTSIFNNVPELIALIEECLSFDFEKRPTADQAKKKLFSNS